MDKITERDKDKMFCKSGDKVISLEIRMYIKAN